MAGWIRHPNPEALRLRARSDYEAGQTVHTICKALHVSTKTMQIWCADLIEARRLALSKRSKNPKPDNFEGYTPLTDDVVITIRRAARASGRKNWKLYAGQYNTSIQHVSDAARGKTFAHVDAIEPPLIDGEAKRQGKVKEGSRKPPMTLALVKELAQLRRDDPESWTYAKLAAIAKERTGKDHRASTLARDLGRFDPSLKAIKDKRAYQKSAPRVKVLSADSKARRLQYARELRKRLKEEDAYEARMAAQSAS